MAQVLTLADPITNAEIDQEVVRMQQFAALPRAQVPQGQLLSWVSAKKTRSRSGKAQRDMAYGHLYTERQKNMPFAFSDVQGSVTDPVTGRRFFRYLTHAEADIRNQRIQHDYHH